MVMVRTAAELLALVRAVVTAVAVGLVSLVMASVVAPLASPESLLLIAALGAATAALLGSRRQVILSAGQPLRLPTRWTGEVLPRLTGRSTDVEHHPQRPRAPGLV